MKVLGKQIYRFDGVELDPLRGCLSRNGEELAVRQKSIKALLYLLEQRHRLVTKEELILRIWEGMAVSDDAVVQLIKELRQCLGDDHRRPRFIKTVPKGGYRFIGAVEELNTDLPALMTIEQHSSVEIEYEEEIIEDGEIGRWGEGETSSQVGKQSPIPSPSRALSLSLSRRFALVAFSAVLLVGGALAAYRFTGGRRSSAQLAAATLSSLPGRKPLAVMYFDNQSGSPDLEWLREGLADMLITNLSRSHRLNVLSRQQLHLLLERDGHSQTNTIRLDDALEIAHRAKAEVIVLGSYVRLGEKIRIDVHLHSAQTGQAFASESMVADKPQDIIAQMELLSLKLAASLNAAPDVQESRTKSDGSMTISLEAYRDYSLAVEKARALHNAEAIALLERAVAIDPQFAMAYARIGYAYTVSWNFPDKAKPYLERAFQLSDRLSERDKLYIKGWYAIANRDYSRAISFFQEIVAAYPMETEAYDRLSSLLTGEDRLEEALEVALRGLVVDAESPNLLHRSSGIYFRMGRHDEAISACKRYIALAPKEPNAYDSLGLYYQWTGRYAEAIATYQQALVLNPQFDVAVVHLGNTYFQQGRYREALEEYRLYIKVAPSDEERARGYGSIAHLYRKQGDLIRSEKAANQEVTYDKRAILNSILINLERGKVDLAEASSKRFFANWSDSSNRGTRGTLRASHYLHGYIHLRSGRPEEALAEFKEALRCVAPSWSIDSYEDCLANAYLELGRLDEAIAEYERILRLNPSYPLAQYHLGQAYERKGQTEQARAAYESFLQSWKDADANQPESIKARRVLAGTN